MLKTVSSITNAIGALNYKGTWDANANSPALASSVGTKGDYYVVGTAGATNLNGITNWGIGDWAAFNGSVWQRVEGGANLNGVDLSVSGTTTLSGLTASTALALDASKNVVSVANTGTGSNVLATAPTLVGDVSLSTGNLVPGTAAKGINFTANTPAAGMTSQLLNWYEEGTFTAVANVLGSGTITLNTNTCHYTRIGRQVTVTGAISVLSVSSPTGDTQIAGFPFTAGRASAVALQGTGFAATASTALVARLDASTTGFYVFHFAVGTSSGSAADFQAGSSLNFSCTYFI